MLSDKDFKLLSEVIHREVRLAVNEVVPTIVRPIVREELSKEIESRGLVTRNEMLTHFDAMMGEFKAIRENLAASLVRQQEHDYLFQNHENRIQKIERQMVGTGT